jgi:hypothetical protein
MAEFAAFVYRTDMKHTPTKYKMVRVQFFLVGLIISMHAAEKKTDGKNDFVSQTGRYTLPLVTTSGGSESFLAAFDPDPTPEADKVRDRFSKKGWTHILGGTLAKPGEFLGYDRFQRVGKKEKDVFQIWVQWERPSSIQKLWFNPAGFPTDVEFPEQSKPKPGELGKDFEAWAASFTTNNAGVVPVVGSKKETTVNGEPAIRSDFKIFGRDTLYVTLVIVRTSFPHKAANYQITFQSSVDFLSDPWGDFKRVIEGIQFDKVKQFDHVESFYDTRKGFYSTTNSAWR